MENNLPVEGNPCWREEWAPLGEGWLIQSPGDMCFSISKRSGIEGQGIMSRTV